MLELEIKPQEYYDESKEIFVVIPGATLKLEHSLVSLSKWESFYEKPFLVNEPRTEEEKAFYIECMLLEPIEDPIVLRFLNEEQVVAINAYINKKHTATWFSEEKGSRAGSREIVTSEIIYYWMVSLNIPFECEYWNLSRLLALIRVINAKNQPQKKMSRAEAAARARELNKQRMEKYNTSG